MTQARLVTVKIERDGRLFVATSDHVRGFLIVHPDRDEVLKDIPVLLRLMLSRKLKQDVIVSQIEDSEDQWVLVPASIAQHQLAIETNHGSGGVF